MAKSKDKVRVSFKDSGAAQDVTGSCTLVEWNKKSLLVDSGLIQGNYTLLQEYQLNSRKTSYKDRELNYIFLTHNHVDHSGAIPLRVRRGFEGTIIIPKGSKNILKEMWLDSAKILARDAMDLTKRAKKLYMPLFDEGDVYKALSLVKEYDFGVKYRLEDDLEFEFYPAGHIILSAQLVLYIKNGNSIKKIGFTGDLGNLKVPRIFSNEFKPIPNTNLLIGECTYANKERSVKAKDRDKDLEKIKSVVYDVCIDGINGKKGKILFPTFSLQRTQQMLRVLYDLFREDSNFNIPVYICSPLACRISNLFYEALEGEQLEQWEECATWEHTNYIDNFEKLQEILGEDRPMIMLASSGMLQVGYSQIISEKLLPKSNCALIFCGFSVEGTLAYKIKQKKTKTITINGKAINNRAIVVNLNSFSSHIQHDEMIDYYSGGFGTGLYGKICLNHGEFKAKCEFGKELQETIEKRNRSDKVIVVNKSTEILL